MGVGIRYKPTFGECLVGEILAVDGAKVLLLPHIGNSRHKKDDKKNDERNAHNVTSKKTHSHATLGLRLTDNSISSLKPTNANPM